MGGGRVLSRWRGCFYQARILEGQNIFFLRLFHCKFWSFCNWSLVICHYFPVLWSFSSNQRIIIISSWCWQIIPWLWKKARKPKTYSSREYFRPLGRIKHWYYHYDTFDNISKKTFFPPQDQNSECVTIPRSLDSRLQVLSKAARVKIFIWFDFEQNRNK